MKNKKGYALIYALLFIVLMGVTVGAIMTASNADIILQRRSDNAAVAFQLAKQGMDDGWVYYRGNINPATNPSGTSIVPSSPTVCTNVNRVIFAQDGSETTSTPALTQIPLSAEQLYGAYDYRVCWEGGSVNKERIDAIGYSKGNKITLQGYITHSNDTSVGCPGASCVYDHSNDTLSFNQIGPLSN